ncbi:MAG: hypothetical protein KKA64_00910 [Nanoarchaeota archaeon]|nr:hypothetical protein [Nanoarchaeota archaeon]
MKYNIPDQFMGKSLKELMKEEGKGSGEKPKTNGYNPELKNPEDYVLLEAKDYREMSYPDLLVCKYRLGANADVMQAGKTLGLDLTNTATEENRRGYAGDMNWKQALTINSLLGGRTANLRQFVDFLKLLKSGKAFNAKGDKIDSKELENILNEIIQIRASWRSEWIDGDFKTKEINEENIVYLNSNHILQNGVLIPQYSEVLKDYLNLDKTPGIDFDKWIDNATEQGMPRANIKKGQLYYWAPNLDNNSVSRFDANSDRADLYCYRDPSDSYSHLGVRAVRLAKGAVAQK